MKELGEASNQQSRRHGEGAADAERETKALRQTINKGEKGNGESPEPREPRESNSTDSDVGSGSNQSSTGGKEIHEISTLSIKEPSSLALPDASCTQTVGAESEELRVSHHSKDSMYRRRSHAHGLRRSHGNTEAEIVIPTNERRRSEGTSTAPSLRSPIDRATSPEPHYESTSTTPSLRPSIDRATSPEPRHEGTHSQMESSIDRAKAELVAKIGAAPDIQIVEPVATEVHPHIPLSVVSGMEAHAIPVPLHDLANTILTASNLHQDPAPQEGNQKRRRFMGNKKHCRLILGGFFFLVAGVVALAVSLLNQKQADHRDCVSSPVTEDELGPIRQDIELLVDTYHPMINLAAKFVRLGFHACVGGCHGCVDGTDPDNVGLEMPIEFLHPIVSRYENECISRADIWTLAALIGADLTQSQEDFPMLWVGRKNCDAKDPLKGPGVKMPGPFTDIHQLLAYFSNEFGFNAQQSVALMGAHSIGKVHPQNSRFIGRGWDLESERLDNEYYRQLQDNKWVQVKAGRYQWAGGYGGSGKADEDGVIMLNADIALVKDFSKYQETDGAVTCNFEDGGSGHIQEIRNNTKACPYAAATRSIVEEYRNSNSMFLRDFSDVFNKLLIHGYNTEDCNGDNPCLVPVSKESLDNGGHSLGSIEHEDRITACKEVASSLFIDQSVWNNPYSPPFRACKWIAEIDQMGVDFWDESAHHKIKQRLLLVWFYYHTTQGSEQWPRCNPPETGEGPGCLHQRLESHGFQGETFDQKMIEPAFRWLTHTDECRWAGIKCNDVGQITHLQLGGYKLEASFPAELAHLKLQVLDLQQNKLSGTLPPTLVTSAVTGSPSKLQTLHLHQNRLTGTIPSDWCSDSEDRPPLERLNLGRNQLTGQLPYCLSALQQLKDFSVMHNQLTGTIPELGGDLANLEEVHLASNKFEGSIPDLLCKTESVLELSADCMASPADNYVECHCCTKCCDPEEGTDFCTVVITKEDTIKLSQKRKNGPF